MKTAEDNLSKNVFKDFLKNDGLNHIDKEFSRFNNLNKVNIQDFLNSKFPNPIIEENDTI